MTTPKIVGNANGIILWNIMSSSSDKLEQDYFARLNSAASKFGIVWFSDCVTQRKSNINQTVWQLTWDIKKTQWNVTRFHIPEGAKEVTDRMVAPTEIIEIDVLDLEKV